MEEQQTTRRWEALMARWDRSLRWSLLVSVLFHVLLVLLFMRSPAIPQVASVAAGERNDDDQAAAGGGSEIVALRIVEPTQAPPDEPVIPIPVPVPEPRPEVRVEPEPPRQATAQPLGTSPSTSTGEGRGQDTGPGTETGTGRGDGGTGESGLNRLIPPSPRGLILPPSDRPGRVRGKTITVYVWVTERGTVHADSTRLAPGSGDGGFDTRLRRQAAEWVFHPARRDGQAIAAWFEYTITL